MIMAKKTAREKEMEKLVWDKLMKSWPDAQVIVDKNGTKNVFPAGTTPHIKGRRIK